MTRFVPVGTRVFVYTPKPPPVLKDIVTHSTTRAVEIARTKTYWKTLPTARTVIHTYVPPVVPPFTQHQTPTTVSEIDRTPEEPYETERVPRPPTLHTFVSLGTEEVTESQPWYTETRIVPASTEGYECVYTPTPSPPVATCKTYIREEKCTPGSFERWKKKIEKCIYHEVQEDGKSLDEIIRQKRIDEFEEYVSECVSKIGNTVCRNKSVSLFDSFSESVQTVVGGYSGTSLNRLEINDELYFEIQKCVTLIDEQKMEKCYPGLYSILTAIILYGRSSVKIEVIKPKSPECLPKVVQHCDLETRRGLEAIMSNIFENECIRFTDKSEPCVCKRNSSHGTSDCDSNEMAKFKKDLNDCRGYPLRNSKGNAYSEDLLKIYVDCVPQTLPGNCRVRKWKNVKEMIEHLVDYLHEDLPSKCTKQMKSNRLKECAKVIVDLVPIIYNAKDETKAMEPVVRCVQSALRSCSLLSAKRLLVYILKIMSAYPIDFDMFNTPFFTSAISSYKVYSTDLSICENVYRTTPGDYGDRPSLTDDCVALYTVKGQTVYAVVPSCNLRQVLEWIKRIKECVEAKTTNIGLKNPDYLTLTRVLIILKTCIDCEKTLGCRVKYLPDFKKILKFLIDISKQNSLTEKKEGCRDLLKFDTFARCINVHHKYYALATDPESFSTNQKKSLRCLRDALKCCKRSVIEHFMDVLDLTFLPDPESMNGSGRLQTCTPGSQVVGGQVVSGQVAGGDGDQVGGGQVAGGQVAGGDGDQVAGGQVDGYPSFQECGPGGILVRMKRDPNDFPTSPAVPPKHEKFADSSSGSKRSADGETTDLEGRKECDSAVYISYLQRLKKCEKKRLHLKYRRAKNKCYMSDIIKSWTAMIECLIEGNVGVLICKISREDQLGAFLQQLSATLESTSERKADISCPDIQWCKDPPLEKCAHDFYQLLETKEQTNRVVKILNGIYEVQECLLTKWPGCPSRISAFSIPIVLSALGLDFDSSVAKSSKLVSCRVVDPELDQSDSNCLSDVSITQESSVHLLDHCKTCIRKKEGICSYNNITDMLQVVEADISRFGHCLKVFLTNNNCIRDVTERIRDTCLPHFYRFLEHVKGGRVLNFIDTFQEFNQCLVNYNRTCPEMFQYVVPEIYYDILGLDPSFRKNLIMLG